MIIYIFIIINIIILLIIIYFNFIHNKLIFIYELFIEPPIKTLLFLLQFLKIK